MRKFLLLFMLSLFATFSFSQEITGSEVIVSSKKDANITDHKGNAYYKINCKKWGFIADRPGVHKPYRDTSDYYTTICSNDSGKGIRVSFQRFAMEKFDKLEIFSTGSRSGQVTAATIPPVKNNPKDDIDFKGAFTGYSSPGTITSRRGGCLIFHFTSDATVAKDGWYAKITCAKISAPDPCPNFEKKYVDSDLKCGVEISDDNFRGKNNFELYGDCTMPGWPASGPELIYKFVNKKASDLRFTLKENNGNQPKILNMYILNDCRPDACIYDPKNPKPTKISRPAKNGDQDRDYVLLKNAPAGVYYVVIDGNKPYAHNSYTLLVECTGGDYTTCSNPYYYDDFEQHHANEAHGKKHSHQVDYHVGDYLSFKNPLWSRGQGVGLRDARISKDRSSNGTQSVEFNRADEGTQDVYLDLGRKFKGVYRICWNMYIENHHTAFFALFGGDNSDPWGAVSKEFSHGNSYTGRWFDVELFVDLNKNKYTLYLDNRCKKYSGDYHLNLYTLNFYGLPKAHFYIDHLCYGAVSGIPSSRIAPLPAESTPLAIADKKLQGITIPTVTDNNDYFAPLTSSIEKLNELQVSPNPTRGFTTISLNLAQEQNVNLQIFSQTGQVVRNIALGQTQFIKQDLDLTDLPNGLYLIRAMSEKSVITKKIILQQ